LGIIRLESNIVEILVVINTISTSKVPINLTCLLSDIFHTIWCANFGDTPDRHLHSITSMDDDYILIMLEDAVSMGVIEAPCNECGELVRCEPDAIDAWCDNCEKVCRVEGLAAMGMI
jgi:hypothetical protein